MSLKKTTIGLLVVVGFTPTSFGSEGGSIEPVTPLSVRTVPMDGGRWAMALDGEAAFHTTPNAVSEERVVDVAGTPTRVVVWNETEANGNVVPFYGVALDGRTFNRITSTSYVLKLRFANFDPLRAVPDVPETLRMADEGRRQTGSPVFIVQFITQPLQVYRDAIAALGGQTHRFLANHAHIVQMSPEVKAQVGRLPFVRWVGPYHPAYRLDDALLLSLRDPEPTLQTQRYNIEVFERGPMQKEIVADRIDMIGGIVEAQIPGGFVLEATLTADQLIEVIHMNEVSYVDTWSKPITFMNNVRIDGGADYIENVAGYTGEGVRAEVMDTELDTNHQAFQARPPLIHPSGGPGGIPHGTSVYGINFGDGTGNADGRGMIPDAQGIFAQWIPRDRHAHTAELVRAPYFAVYQTNSWGQCCRTNYGSEAREMDDLAFLNDFLLLQAQANNGSQVSSGHAWGKNIVSVGGIRHFNTLPRGDDRWNRSGSIGPAEDGRIKPDLAYWYDSILTTSRGGGYTTGFGGTSAATPETAGHFGLMFQMWSDGIFGNPVDPEGTVFENRPHLATAKALMINTAEPYDFTGPNHDLTRVHQGFGLANVKNLFDLRDEIFFIDETDVLENMDSTTHLLDVQQGTPALKATLVYTDLPGTTSSNQHRINDLSLKVTSPSGTVYHGNRGLLEGNWSTPGGNPNTIDTVENVWVKNPEPGKWAIEVSADEINKDGHVETEELDADYGLIVSGVLAADPEPGACCFDDGSCSDLLPSECVARGGRWNFGRECKSFDCPTAGACCIDNNTCRRMLKRECDRIPDAKFIGEGVSCRRACRCDQIKKFKAKCTGGGTIKAKLKNRDDRFDGETVTFRIGERLKIDVKIKGKKAKLFICCFSGPQTVSLHVPEGCRDPIEVDCP